MRRGSQRASETRDARHALDRRLAGFENFSVPQKIPRGPVSPVWFWGRGEAPRDAQNLQPVKGQVSVKRGVRKRRN